jgi:PRC-barrel domain protein
MKVLLTAASLVMLTAMPAFAQSAVSPSSQNAPAAAPAALDKTTGISGSAQISAKALLNEDVKNAANESIGDINDVLIGSDGKIAAVIVGVGGFLGMGEKDVALPFGELMFAKSADDDLIVSTRATKETLQTAPEYRKPADAQ